MAKAEKKNEKKDVKQDIQKVESPHVLAPFEEMQRQFDNYFSQFWMHPLRMDWPSLPKMKAFEGQTPSVDVIDRDNEVIVKAQMPYISTNDVRRNCHAKF